MVSLPQKHFIAIVVGVCVLSAGIGSGLALLAETGPAGAAGKRGAVGPEGPRGPAGPSAEEEIAGLEAEVDELRGEVETSGELEERVEDLEFQLSDLGGVNEELCEEFGVFC